MYIPEIPNNSLTEEIKEIVKNCNQRDSYSKNRATVFNPPATYVEINAYEKKNSILLPQSYKDWLMFSNGSRILFNLMTINSLELISNEIVSNDLIVIGTLIGDGELLCFSKNTGKIIWFDDGRTEEYDDLKPILLRIINLMQGKSGVSQSSIDVLMSMVEASRNNGEKN